MINAMHNYIFVTCTNLINPWNNQDYWVRERKNFQNPLVARDKYDHNQSSKYSFYSSLVRLSFGEIVFFLSIQNFIPKRLNGIWQQA